MDTISIGKHNPLIADVRKAVQRGALTRDGLLVIEGPKLIWEAYDSGIPIESLLVREGSSFASLPHASSSYTLESSVFKSIQDTEHSQGMIGLVRPRQWTLTKILDDLRTPLAVLAGLQDPGNVGTILRVAEAFGAGGCLGLAGTVSIHNSKVLRASSGSIFRLPHFWNLPLAVAAEELEARKIPIIGTSPHAADSIVNWDWRRPAAVLIGNEGVGLTKDQTSVCSAMLSIPHASPTESLNSAIAAAVVFYEALRRRTHR